MSDLTADYIVVGAGTAGLVLAHRVKKHLPNASVIVIEAGEDNTADPNAQTFTGMFSIMMTKSNYFLQVTSGLDKANFSMGAAGRALGGSATINAGVWFRGPAADWDTWAEVSNESAWKYENMIPFFKRTENLKDAEAAKDDKQHSTEGYLNVWSAKALLNDVKWPLREAHKAAWEDAGVDYLPDPNNGAPNGLGEQISVWDRGQRQFAYKFLDLSGIQIISATAVEKIVFDKRSEVPKAQAVRLSDGRTISANKEIIVSAGSYNSPKILLLSGIGDRSTLSKHNIECVYGNASVGSNLIEHLCSATVFKLKQPAALGAPALASASGFPSDFTYHGQVANHASAYKHGATNEQQNYLSRPNSSNIQTCLWYMPLSEPQTGIALPMPPDGTIVSAVTCLVSPTSRGSVSLRSSDPNDPPVIDQNFYATEADRFILREGLKHTSSVYLDTKAGQSFIAEQLVPEGHAPITADTSDADIDARVRRFGWSIQHPMGTCAMGTVVDGRCKVKGVEGLRVADVSVLPTALGCNTQPAAYAIGERVADWVAGV
jgi:choline dehydrogenase-like flavoprotein